MCMFMQVQVQMQVQVGTMVLATVQCVPCRCGWPLHLDRNLRRGLQLETPRLALQQVLGSGGAGGIGAGGGGEIKPPSGKRVHMEPTERRTVICLQPLPRFPPTPTCMGPVACSSAAC